MSGVHCQRFPDCMELTSGNEMPRCAKPDCPGKKPSELLKAMFPSPCDAAQRAYGLLWREQKPSMFSRDARKQLLDSLSPEQRRAGIAWAIEHYGPMTTNEIIAADIRAGVFPEQSTERQT